MGAGAPEGRIGRTALAVVALLILLTAAAFVWSQRLKRQPLVIDRVEIRALPPGPSTPKENDLTPDGDCRDDRIRVVFRTTRSDTADVVITDRAGREVRALASDRFLKRYRIHSFVWDGRDDDGNLVAGGAYGIGVRLLGQGRDLELPRRVRVIRTPASDSACRVAR